MAACAFHSHIKQRCPPNCIFRGIFLQSDANVENVRSFFTTTKLVESAKLLSGVERDADLVPTPEINAFLREIYNFAQDVNIPFGGPYARMDAVIKNLKEARSFLTGDKPFLADALVDISIKILEKETEVFDCLSQVEALNLEFDKEAEEQKIAAEQEVAAEAEQEVAAKAEQEVAAEAEQEVPAEQEGPAEEGAGEESDN